MGDGSGNRICTVLVYLNDVATGGKTTFQRAAFRGAETGLSIAPVAGRAVIFFPADYESGVCDPLALHEAEPAESEKWVCQLWVRQSPPGSQRTAAGRAEASARLMAADDSAHAAAEAAGARSRPPRPEPTPGNGVWRYFD